MTTFSRRPFAALAALGATTLAILALGASSPARAQGAYPSKPVTMVVPTAAGGTTDLSARMLAQALARCLASRWWWTTRAAATAPSRPARSSAPRRTATRS